jgi:hypothetical protein
VLDRQVVGLGFHEQGIVGGRTELGFDQVGLRSEWMANAPADAASSMTKGGIGDDETRFLSGGSVARR